MYLENPQGGSEPGYGYPSPVVKLLPQIGDFLSLGTGLLLVPSVMGPKALAKAWTRPEPVPSFSVDLPPPLRLRWSAGVPQLLKGPEKAALQGLAARFHSSPAVPLGLPIVNDQAVLLGALVLLDCPPFDLEDETFELAWTQLKYTLIHQLAPKPRPRSTPPASRLQLTLSKGHHLLAARMETTQLMRHAEQHGLLPQRARAVLESALGELAGDQGAVIAQSPWLTAFFVLPGKMDRDLLWHQILGALTWPAGFQPKWELTVLSQSSELSQYLRP